MRVESATQTNDHLHCRSCGIREEFGTLDTCDERHAQRVQDMTTLVRPHLR